SLTASSSVMERAEGVCDAPVSPAAARFNTAKTARTPPRTNCVNVESRMLFARLDRHAVLDGFNIRADDGLAPFETRQHLYRGHVLQADGDLVPFGDAAGEHERESLALGVLHRAFGNDEALACFDVEARERRHPREELAGVGQPDDDGEILPGRRGHGA